MEDGKFTRHEVDYLTSLDAVDYVKKNKIFYSNAFKAEFIQRYNEGEKPKSIFESAGLHPSIIGYKRIERCCARWRESELRDSISFCDNDGEEKYDLLDQGGDTNRTESCALTDLDSQEQNNKTNAIKDSLLKRRNIIEKQIEKIALQRAEIERLEDQVKILKLNDELSKSNKKASPTTKSQRFQLIAQQREKDPKFNVCAACEALGVSKSGYYKHASSQNARNLKLV